MPATSIAPRSNTTQQVNYERKLINFNAPAGPQFIGSIPVNSVIMKVDISIGTAFNAATPTITLGITPGGSELAAAGDSTPGTAGYYTPTRGLGMALTLASPPANTVGDPQGGVPLYLSVSQGAAAATPAGFGAVCLSFIPPLPENAIAGG